MDPNSYPMDFSANFTILSLKKENHQFNFIHKSNKIRNIENSTKWVLLP